MSDTIWAYSSASNENGSAKRHLRRHLVPGVGAQPVRDLGRGPDQVRGEQQRGRPLGDADPFRPRRDVRPVPRLLLAVAVSVGMTTRPARSGHARGPVCVEVGLDLRTLVRREVVARLGARDARGEQVEAVLRRPDGGARAAGAVPDAVGEPGALAVGRRGELLDPAALDAVRHRVAAHEVAEAQEPSVAEVLVLGGVRVDRVAVQVVVHGVPHREPRCRRPPSRTSTCRGPRRAGTGSSRHRSG